MKNSRTEILQKYILRDIIYLAIHCKNSFDKNSNYLSVKSLNIVRNRADLIAVKSSKIWTLL